MNMCPIPNGFRGRAIRMYNLKIVYKKDILRVRTISNTGIYCSSDRIGTVCYSNGHSKKKYLYEHVSYSERFPR